MQTFWKMLVIVGVLSSTAICGCCGCPASVCRMTACRASTPAVTHAESQTP